MPPSWVKGQLCGFRRPAVDWRGSSRRSKAHIDVDELEVLATLSYSHPVAQEDGPWPGTPESLAPLIASRSPLDAAHLSSGPSALEREGDTVSGLSILRIRSEGDDEPRRWSPSRVLVDE